MIKITETDKAPAAIGPYSQAVNCNGILYTSGQIPVDAATGLIVGETIEEQAEQSAKNVRAILEANGIGFEKVIKTTCFLNDMSYFAAFNTVYEKYFISRPARSCIAVKELPKNVLVEIEVIAEL